jgi:Tol biopolymer transport system component
MRKTITIILIILGLIAAQQFGRNKVKYDNYEWYQIKTTNFQIYYPKGYEHLMEFAVVELERGLDQLENDFSYIAQKRFTIVIYPSRFDFIETNIIPYILTESVGGFTEYFKNRVVVPFNGNWEDYRHVLVHELTHAFVFDFLYGSSSAGILSLSRIFNLSLWMAEGLSEFESKGWDSEADMYIRDAIINDYVMPPEYLNGYLAYKQGQSMIHYIAERWGREKIGETIAKGKIELSEDRVIKASLGIAIEDFYEDWKLWARKRYYPDISDHSIQKDIATRLTDHIKDKSFFSLQPAYNPQKEQIAYISNRGDYVNLYLMDIPTQMVHLLEKGERTSRAQSFHEFSSRLSFSPNGKYLLYSVKLGGIDGIVTYDLLRRKRIKTLTFQDDGIREISSPVYSPDGLKIVFAGLANGQRDLYLADTSGDLLEKLTDDIYDDNYPTFSPDGNLLAFTSDRPLVDTTDPGNYPKFDQYGRYNIFLMDMESQSIKSLTEDGANNIYPSFSPIDNRLVYTSRVNGVASLYLIDLEDDTTYVLSDFLGDAICPSFSGKGSKIAFSGFWFGGWDIYLLESIKPLDSLKKYQYVFETGPYDGLKDTSEVDMSVELYTGELSKFKYEEDMDSSGPKPYKPYFTADLAMVNVGYSTYYGIQGSSLLMLSDLLGDHQIIIATDLSRSIDNSNFYLGYGYMKKRTDMFFSLFHYKYYFRDNYWNEFSDRNYGTKIDLRYPFSQFTRAEFKTTFFSVDRYYYTSPYEQFYSENLLLQASYVKDNTLWGSTGPVVGERYLFNVDYLPNIGRNPLNHMAMEVDGRKYLQLGGNYSLAMRFSAGYSFGKHRKTYYLGGTPQWIYYKKATNNVYSLEDIYINSIISPLRGYDYFEIPGHIYSLINIEFRYPFIEYLSLGFPPMTVQGLNGAIFMDLGGATEGPLSSFRFFEHSKFKDPKMGLGFGFRSWIWIFAMQYDIAWRSDFTKAYGKPHHYWSLNLEF